MVDKPPTVQIGASDLTAAIHLLVELVEGPLQVLDGLVKGLESVADLTPLLVVENDGDAASGTDERLRVVLQPSPGFRRLLATLRARQVEAGFGRGNSCGLTSVAGTVVSRSV